MGPSLVSKTLQGTAVTALTSIGAFYVWTKHCHFEPLSDDTDPIFQTEYLKKYNPSSNPTTHDLCVRRLALTKLNQELVKDASEGGTKLLERFCAGVFGGFGYTPQRLYLSQKYKTDATSSHQLWTKLALQQSTYDPGTQITDHFEVLTKTPTSIVVWCGDSPLKKDVRPSDGLFEMDAEVNLNKGFAEFRLKSVFYQGLGRSEKGPMEGFMLWAHRQYTKLWMESAVGNCKR